MFENSIMLAGLGGAVVPLVIHLLGRARYRTVEWGATMFLEPGARGRRDPGQLREWILLLVRMVAVALLAIALARPVSGMIGSATGETRVVAAIVIDCSGSMSFKDVGGSRIEQARAASLQILSTLKRGDRVALILANAGPIAPPQLSGDLQSMANRVAEIEPTPGSADLPAAIEVAAGVLGRQDRVSRQLFVICDRQSFNWNSADDGFIQSWRAHAPLARFAVIPIGGREADNVAIDSISLINPPAVAGCPGEVQIRVRNLGDRAQSGVPLIVRIGGREMLNTTINLGASEVKSVAASVLFGPAGLQFVSATVAGVDADLDDRREMAIDVASPLHTLLVQGDEGESWAHAALAPFTSTSTKGADVAAVDEATADTWDGSGLSSYRVVIVDNVDLSSGQIAALEQFVYAGGGLLLAPGPASRTDQYNRLLFREDNGLLPALLQPPLSSPTALSIERASIDLAHPMMHFLRGQNGEISATIDRYFPITARTASSHVLASFTSGDPFIMESPYGRGRVLLVTCSLRAEWSTLPLTTLYLPLLQSATRYLASSNAIERNIAAGDEIVATFEPPIDAVHATVTRPDGVRETIDLTSAETRSEARYTRTDVPGIYTIIPGPRNDRSQTFYVTPPSEESDLAPLDEPRWQELASSLGFTRMEPTSTPLAARLVGRRGGDEHWFTALAGVLVLLMLELALARTWMTRKAAA